MAVIHVSNGGTRSSGVSIPGVWDESNNYPFSSITDAFSAASDGDEIIFNTGTYLVDNVSLNNLPAGDVTIRSRNYRDAIFLNNTATNRLFTHNPGSGVVNLTFYQVVFDGNGTARTSNTNALLQFGGGSAGGNLIFKDTAIQNFLIDSAGVADGSSKGWVARNTRAGYNTQFIDVDFLNIEIDCEDRGGVFIAMEANNDIILTNVNLDNITINCADVCEGVIYVPGGQTGDVLISGLRVNNLRIADESSDGSGEMNGLVQLNEGKLEVTDYNINDVRFDGPGSTSALFKVTFGSDSFLKHGTLRDIYSSGSEANSSNRIGLNCLALGDDITVTVEDVSLERVAGFYGAGAYSSNGANLVARRVIGRTIGTGKELSEGGTQIDGVFLYSGGDGDSTWEDCACDEIYSDYDETYSRIGLAVRVIHADRPIGVEVDPEAKTHTEIGCRFSGVDDTIVGYSAGAFSADGQTLTIDSTDCLIDMKMEFVDNNGVLSATYTNLHQPRGEAGIDTSTLDTAGSEVTFVNLITDEIEPFENKLEDRSTHLGGPGVRTRENNRGQSVASSRVTTFGRENTR